MEDERRKPSDLVFQDIVQACEIVWWRGGHHPDYEAEKLAEVRRVENYADNWCHLIGMFDTDNQVLMCCNLKYQESIDFLRKMRKWYRIALPLEKVSASRKDRVSESSLLRRTLQTQSSYPLVKDG